MSEVMYYELGTQDLKVVPKASLVPIHNYEQVERVWAVESFKLIDVGSNKVFMTLRNRDKLEKTNRFLATLHWGDNIPPHLQKDRYFWVGPIDECIDALHSLEEVGLETDTRVQIAGETRMDTTLQEVVYRPLPSDVECGLLHQRP